MNLRNWLNRFRFRRGSSTIEYVVVLSAGLMLAMILHSVIDGDTVQTAIRDKVQEYMAGKNTSSDENKDHNKEASDLLAQVGDAIRDSWKNVKEFFTLGTERNDIQQVDADPFGGNGGFNMGPGVGRPPGTSPGNSGSVGRSVGPRSNQPPTTPETTPRGRTFDTGKFREVEWEGTYRPRGDEPRNISRRVYQRNDIDWNRVDHRGRTNLQRARRGNAPIGRDGEEIQLHHVTGKEPGAMAEMLGTEHRRYSGPIHRLIEYSFRNNRTLNNQYEAFRKQYWKWRARSLE